MLQLPDFNALSEEQDDILDLPLDVSTLITGPPGTGKTIMAIYRAQMLDKARRPTLLLMYGKLLSTYTKAAVKESGIDGVVSTYHSWFPRFYQETYGSRPPAHGGPLDLRLGRDQAEDPAVAYSRTAAAPHHRGRGAGHAAGLLPCPTVDQPFHDDPGRREPAHHQRPVDARRDPSGHRDP